MAKQMPATPLLDQLEDGPWPSFVTGLKRLANDESQQYAPMMKSLLGQLEHSYDTRKGYWKGGTVGVRGYGGGIIPRFSEVAGEYPESSEFHTMRVMPPAGMHYDTKTLRDLCDIWEKYGSGLIAFHGQSGDIMFQGISSANIQVCFDEMNEIGFDLGGAGAAIRTSMSCVGAARCEQSNYDEARAMRTVINNLLDDMHRPSLPYKMKFKFSGCANDCVNASHRSDVAVLGTWRDDIKVDQDKVKEFVNENGRKMVNDQVINMCPTRALSLNDDDTLDIDNRSCVRCMHCINVMTKALSPGDDKGISILVGGKRTLKIGDLMGSMVVPFMKLETDEDFEKLTELTEEMVEFFAENALEHERTGEMIDRIGLINYLDALGLDVDPNMVAHPRTSSYVRMDDWDEQAEKWDQRKSGSAAAE
ncbi:MAG: dissimilatory-type sulfite reductase subunit alpha [Rhodospirillaceae bacterium]|jgi:sulfite reductase alpha subunit|nr:dissimilatory-type sulfite reductase subunit alpha [Rhodospirillaceae bacterium]MBT5244131.1 dissimilatory-type sulfite reductase subunit alpha [Rhodospirillaceae bacterium]MBT5561656.1 dissimilatory-type sulfite reductase subunit alpha [Rhodospirillaceae bacterium]MBT6243095.1 dissimilatory-type sulfite reductase subunit alpha [Rhodospirillaceae bacterium]MBT7138471.1 dissimilatory-type sulfite reductase subunit alpha [Rhodospirillaceae bacterium]